MIDQALILAAGHGSRLRDHVQVPHKALVEIEGESLLSRTCRMLEQSGLREIVLVTGHRSAELRAALEAEKTKATALAKELQRFREEPVQSHAAAEIEEEFITNTLSRKLSKLQSEKSSLEQHMETEQEFMVNRLQRQLRIEDCVQVVIGDTGRKPSRKSLPVYEFSKEGVEIPDGD